MANKRVKIPLRYQNATATVSRSVVVFVVDSMDAYEPDEGSFQSDDDLESVLER